MSKKNIKILFFIILFTFPYINSFAQNQLDSLDTILNVHIKKEGEDTVTLKYLKKLFSISRFSKPYLALEYAGQALQFAQKKNDSIEIAGWHDRIGDVYYSQKVYYLAMKSYFECYKIFTSLGKIKEAAYSQISIGDTYMTQNVDDIAEEYFNKALITFKLLNDYTGISLSLSKLGFVNLKLFNYNNSLSNFAEAIRLAEKTNDIQMLAQAYAFSAEAYKQMEDYPKAIDALSIALKKFKLVNERNKVGEIYLSLGEIFLKQNDLITAQDYYRKANILFEELDFPLYISETLNRIANIFFVSGDYASAIEYSKKAIIIANQNGLLYQKRDAYLLLSNIYSFQGNTKLAFEFIKKHSLVKDSIWEAKKQEQFTEIQVSLETQRQEKEIEILKRDKSIQINQLKQKQTINYGLIIFGVIMVAFVLYVIRNIRRIKSSNNLLQAQFEEINLQKQEIQTQAENLEKLSIVASETSSAVVIMDNKGNFEWINAGFTKMYGYTFQLLINELDENIILASKHPNIKNIIHKCLTEKNPVIYESAVITRTGEKKWAHSALTPILDSERNVKKLVLIDSDITKIKEAEVEIKSQYKMITQQAKEFAIANKELEKLSLVASKTENSVIIAKTNGEIEWVNEAFERMLEITFSEFKERYGSNIFTSSLNPNLKQQVDEAVAEKKSIIYTAKTTTKKGRLIWIQTTLTPIFNEFNRLAKYIAIDADVTKIKLAEEEIAKQKQKIIESIQYARRIQNAVMPSFEMIGKFLPDHFILFLPKDIVSGDFYWAMQLGKKFVVVAADCTGHGVPGAFMSMLGITFLSNIVVSCDENSVQANYILNKLRENIKDSLHQTGKERESKDGMDISLCIFDLHHMELQFAGAHNALLIVRNKKILEFSADDMPIGISRKEKNSFTNKFIKLEHGDRLYISTDGYLDQFGGANGRKFMIKRFKEIITKIAELPMNEQHKIMENAHIEWKGEQRQIDDILVIGMRV